MEEVQIVVRRGLASLEKEIRKKHKITGTRVDCRIEDDEIIFIFSAGNEQMPSNIAKHKKGSKSRPVNRAGVMHPTSTATISIKKRRKKVKRRRMRTRSWKVIASFTNSFGQKARVYEPFVEVLQNEGLSQREQKMAVEKILRSNKNNPTEDSVDYFLNNTLEYLKSIENNRRTKS